MIQTHFSIFWRCPHDGFTIFFGPYHYLFEVCLKPLVVAQVTLVPEQVALGLDAAIERSRKRHVEHLMNACSTRY